MISYQQALLSTCGKLLMGCLLLITLTLQTQASALETLVLSAQNDQVAVMPYTEHFEDKSRTLTLKNLLEYPEYAFKPSQEKLAFGRSESAWWVHFNLVNQADIAWYLLLDANLGEDLDLYIFPADLPVQAIHSELTKQYALPLKNYPRHVWQLELPPYKIFNVYIRATNGGSILNLPIQFMQANELITHTFYNYRLVSVVFAGMLVLAAYQMLMFLVLRESSYIILAVYMLSMMLTLHRNTPIFESLSFLSNTGSHFFTAPFFIVIAASAGFTREILNTAYYAPKLDWVFKTFIAVSLMALFLIGFLQSSSNYPPMLGMALLLFTFFTSLYVASKGYRLAVYFTFIYLLYLGIYLPILVILIWETHLWQPLQDVFSSLGALVFMLFISIIQAERMRTLREKVSQSELANKAKDEFLAIISHELRTPMNAVVGLGTLLKLTPLSNVQKVYVEKLDIATQHMMQLISNVLDFAKFRSANFKPIEEPFKLILVLNSVAPLIEQQCLEKNLTFNLKVEGSVEDSLLGDRLHLTQILFNLLDNAIKYTEQGGITLKISTKQQMNQQLQVVFTVVDTGRGIDVLDVPRLFEPFVQVHPSIQRREGVGLGLAISKRLVESMRGTLKVESALGKGSQFVVDVCFKLAPASDSEMQSLLTSSGRKLTLPQPVSILLLDNSELSRLIGGAMLRELGATVYTAASTTQAQVVLAQSKIDLVLLDLGGLEGQNEQFLAWLRQHELAPIPVISRLLRQAQDLAPDSPWMAVYLNKPFDYETLYMALTKALELRRQSLLVG